MLGGGRPLADKKSLRLVLHGVRSHHERAAPTRSTLQKLNRFFMSGRYEETEAGSVGGGGAAAASADEMRERLPHYCDTR